MTQDWQSIAALAVVLLTLAVFIVRAVKSRNTGSCGGACGCERSKMAKPK